MINFENFVYDYKPFPIGVAQPAIDPGLYRELAASYPRAEDFAAFRTDAQGKVTKFSLSARTNPKALATFLDKNPRWRDFYAYLYSPEFTNAMLDHLEQRGIRAVKKRSKGIARLLNRAAPKLAHSRLPGVEKILYDWPRRLGGVSSKVEFSAIPASDGGVLPHTDSPGKVVSLVFAFPNEGEWDPAYGGGTSVVEPKDEREYFNLYNKSLPFDAVEVKKVVEHRPNQVMLFVKTFNSWHAVMPTKGPADAWRKTLTINVMAG